MANIEDHEENRLSPVLNNYKINRKLLQQKKLQRKSSRVKLTERFQSSSTVGDFTGSVSNTEKNNSLSGPAVELSDNRLDSKSPHDTQNPVDKCLQTVHGHLLDFGPDETDQLFENITIIENEMRDKLKAESDSFTVKVAESAIDNATKTCAEELSSIPDSLQIAKVVNFGGFQTASGKSFKLSEAALEIANKRFNEDLSVSDIKIDVEKSSKLSKLESTEDNKGSNSTGLEPKLQESLEGPRKDINSSGRPSFGGFQTASGKRVKLSETAIEAAEKRFKEEFPKISANKADAVDGAKTDFGSCGKKSNADLTATQFPLQRNRNKLPEKISKIDEKPGFSGFQTAAGKEVRLSQSAIDAARKQFNEDLAEISAIETDFGGCKKETSEDLISTQLPQKISKIDDKLGFSGFQTASGNSVKLSQSAIDAAKKRFNEDFSENSQIVVNDNIKLPPPQTKIDSDLNRVTIERKSDGKIRKFCEKSRGFQTASGREVKVSESAIEAANRRFNEDFSKTAEPNNTQAGFSSASGKSLKSLECEELTKVPQSGSFQTASGKGLKLSNSAIEAAKKRLSEDLSVIHVNIDDKENFDSFKYPSGSAIDSTRKDLCEGATNFRDLLYIKTSLHGFDDDEILESQYYSTKLQDIFQETGNNKRKCTFENRQPSKISKTANSIDIHRSSLTQSLNNTTDISTTEVNRSRKRLGMTIKPRPLQQQKLERAKMIFDDLSPIKTNQYAFNSTPIKMKIASVKERPVLFNTTITPIKSNEKTCKIVGESTKFHLQPHTGGNFDMWAANLQQQRVEMENQLRVINARQEALDFQKNLFNNADRFYKQKRQGVLLSRKESATRIPLKSLRIRTNGLERVPKITPQNAALIHFRDDAATIKTEDGALIIPNTNNLIGFTEISMAFKTMPGIELKLLPRLWLENHYKWIVWKLASYENFVENGQDCLNIENIVQQLKYRYDREIDKAERPILRRILEKDDTLQKRIVLCVANINKLVDGKFELELTDGWYGIKTVIDDALSAEILKERIKIGTKLMINNAELLNCDGCHPLETPDSVSLKITSNSTRRTLWHCKLGCYRIPEPFPISLRSIQPTGGLIGCVTVYIARIYPIRYLEKQGKLRVWRNKRAEERRAQEWENEKLKRIEQVQELVRKDYEKSLINSNKTPTRLIPNKCDIVGITCGKTLFELYETSKDPEQFQELLSETQRISMIEFQRNVSFYRQQEINNKIKENINKLDICQRDVAAVLKILVVDAIEESDRGIIFQIWKADEHHLQTLREGSVFRIYNVMPKANGDLSSTSKTRFKGETNDLERFKKFHRILTPISTLLQPAIKLNFNEFDTVGVVVELSINQYDQNFWLSDAKNCMVFVKIFENSKNCSLLENSKIGDTISICNLIYYERQYDCIHTIANHSTIISKYPQSKHLIDGIAKLNEELSIIKDFDEFLVNCREIVSNNLDKISLLRNSKHSSKSLLIDANLLDASETLTEATEESTLTSRITSLDVAMSMIDIDKFT